MSLGLFLSNSSSSRFLGRSRTRSVVIFLSSSFFVFLLSALCFAQVRGTEEADRNSFDRFLTGAYSETNSPRTNGTRPPDPKRSYEGLFYPEGFLTLSKPSPEPDELLPEKKVPIGSESPTEEQPTAKSDAKPFRFLDPGLETTPYVRPLDRASGENTKKGRLFFTAFSIALAALGLFVFFDYRYREQLRQDLERNSRLSSPQAASSDFADFPPGSLDVPIQIPQRNFYESDDYRYGSNVVVDSVPISSVVEEDGERLEANFDFTPQGKVDSDVDLEPQEDFVVSKTDE